LQHLLRPDDLLDSLPAPTSGAWRDLDRSLRCKEQDLCGRLARWSVRSPAGSAHWHHGPVLLERFRTHTCKRLIISTRYCRACQMRNSSITRVSPKPQSCYRPRCDAVCRCVPIMNFVPNSTPRFLKWSNTSSKAEWTGKQSANFFERRYSSSPRELKTQTKKGIRSGRSNSCAVAASDQAMGAVQTEIPHRPW